jgi:hypothetical protein
VAAVCDELRKSGGNSRADKCDLLHGGNSEPQPAIFPDTPALFVRETDKGRELTKMCWGVPSSRLQY